MRHQVVGLDFSSGTYQGPDDLRAEVAAQLSALEEEVAILPREDDTAPARFRRLMKALHERSGQRVAVLIDEYDKPILDALEVPEVARANRDFLHGLYSTVKFADAHIRFTLLTGVSKFSKASTRAQPRVSLFSGLNNLLDLTLDPRYSAVCGYTEADLDGVFAPELPGLDRDEITTWYNGYNWLGDEKVYTYFAALGLDITVEDSSSHGRLDMAVLFGGNVYLFEFKVVEMTPEGAALAQLKARRYADKYRGLGQSIYLIGVEFSKDERNVVAFEMEHA